MSPVVNKLPMEIEPMAASIGQEIPRGRAWTFEPKYDGVRAIAYVGAHGVALVTRNGNDKSVQFPEVAHALAHLGIELARSFVLDGEIVALVNGKPGRFQELQGRMHLKGRDDIAHQATKMPAAYLVFDCLRDGRESLIERPWSERRARLEQLLASEPRSARDRARDDIWNNVRISPSSSGSGETMLARAQKQGWEGVIAKRVDAPYQPGVRSDDWLKLKIDFEQEFVIGGFTEPRNTREHIGALLLGYFDDAGKLVYVGHTGGGFTRQSLADMSRRLSRLVRKTSPFAVPPHTNEARHVGPPRSRGRGEVLRVDLRWPPASADLSRRARRQECARRDPGSGERSTSSQAVGRPGQREVTEWLAPCVREVQSPCTELLL